MRIISVLLIGDNGIARVSRGGSALTRIFISAPPEGRAYPIDSHNESVIMSAARDIQRSLDGFVGTHSEVDEYASIIRTIAQSWG